MSLLHLVHKNVVIKFTDVAKNQFDPAASYAFRLTGVDGMGFLQVQALRAGESAPETDGNAYWINKDLVREIYEVDLATAPGTIIYTGEAAKPKAEVKPEPTVDAAPREVAPKLPKAKVPAKGRTALKTKAIFS
jgi:hypothetical protein